MFNRVACAVCEERRSGCSLTSLSSLFSLSFFTPVYCGILFSVPPSIHFIFLCSLPVSALGLSGGITWHRVAMLCPEGLLTVEVHTFVEMFVFFFWNLDGNYTTECDFLRNLCSEGDCLWLLFIFQILLFILIFCKAEDYEIVLCVSFFLQFTTANVSSENCLFCIKNTFSLMLVTSTILLAISFCNPYLPTSHDNPIS